MGFNIIIWSFAWWSTISTISVKKIKLGSTSTGFLILKKPIFGLRSSSLFGQVSCIGDGRFTPPSSPNPKQQNDEVESPFKVQKSSNKMLEIHKSDIVF